MNPQTSKNIDGVTACTACLVCFISTVNGRSKKEKEKKPIMSCASSRHITKLKQYVFAPFDIYELILWCNKLVPLLLAGTFYWL